MRPLNPVPVTRVRSTPSSRAKRRTDGLAWAPRTSGSVAAVAGVAAETVIRTVASGLGAAACAAAFAAGSAAAGLLPRTVATRSPALTREPLDTCSFAMLPAADEGTSIVAFSVSSVTRGDSSATVSPSFASTSMTSTSLKSPRSGTRTSSVADSPAGFAAAAGTAAFAGGAALRKRRAWQVSRARRHLPIQGRRWRNPSRRGRPSSPKLPRPCPPRSTGRPWSPCRSRA